MVHTVIMALGVRLATILCPYLKEPSCPVCALPTLNGDICGRCLKHQPQFDRTLAIFAYSFPLDKLVQALKFGERLMLADALQKAWPFV
ncbi:MAG: hypothetical protein WDM70_03430 [Nitrosomonadales bacterium]